MYVLTNFIYVKLLGIIGLTYLTLNIDINNSKIAEDQQVKSDVQEKPKNIESVSEQSEKPKYKVQTRTTITNFYKNSSHPFVCLFTFIFKIAAFIIYIIISFFSNQKGLIYLSVILLGSVDFWITKNISGRLLVGLRWWNEVKKDGKEVWIFESKNEKIDATADKSVFWTSLYINGGGWAILFLFKLITLSVTNAIIAFTMLVFAGVNLYGFFKCSKEQQNKLSKLGTKVVSDVAKQQIRNMAK